MTELALTGEPLSAQAALDHGLIVRMCEPGQALDTALELAAAIARNAPLGVEAVKRLLHLAPGGPRRTSGPCQRELVDAVFGLRRRAGGCTRLRREAPATVDGAMTVRESGPPRCPRSEEGRGRHER